MTTLLAPTEREERLGMLDTTRGIAVLGILIMNITGFGLPNSYDDPTNWGGSEGANLTVWRIAALFFEGTMRGMFTLLFGAGALLFLQRHAARNPGLLPADLFFRRTMWLIASSIFSGVRSSRTRSDASTESASIATAVSMERGFGPG